MPGLEVISKILPESYGHKNQQQMNQKVKKHIEPTIDLSEMETGNMVQILELLSMRFLELLVEKLNEPEKQIYSQALFDMRSGKVTLEELRLAEKKVMNVVNKFGKLILFGDQLTVCKVFSVLLNLYIKKHYCMPASTFIKYSSIPHILNRC